MTTHPTTHTPGPWHVTTQLRTINILDNDLPRQVVASMPNNAAGKKHATLIAAAPVLLEALQRLFSGNVDCGTYWKVDSSDMQAAKEAIALASGIRL